MTGFKPGIRQRIALFAGKRLRVTGKILLGLIAMFWVSTAALAEDRLLEIYEKVKAARAEQAVLNHQREQAFVDAKQNQQQLLQDLQQQVTAKRKALAELRARIDEGDQQIDHLQQQLNERAHTLTDLYSVWRQVVADTRSNQQNSLISSQFPDRVATLEALSQRKTLPDAADLSALTLLLQSDLQATGQSVSFATSVAGSNGVHQQARAQRIGPFTLTADGHFLRMSTPGLKLSTVARQPDGELLDHIRDPAYLTLSAGQEVMAVIDPSRGVVLDRLALSPSLQERIAQGGLIGYAIIALGLAGLLLALWRTLALMMTGLKVRQQMRQPDRVDEKNPLGRIIATYHNSLPAASTDQGGASHQETDALEVRLQQIVLQEMPKLDKGLGLLKLLAAVAPLLGLLGTVVGMINTFQTITLVGSADPKLMAGGISQALMTTVLGLVVAVPLLFSHNFVASRSRRLMVFLSQQSLGFIAMSLEDRGRASPPGARQESA
ncbi:MAG: MotA/TolQ/ExbB proton channel family protein [Hahellaceae bacterium]|nr:MotA/TolQ/ExbB proton channel family protein [Hahellaceae bacterium]MCP5170430.1 MotA/TolQ/ExbB proton channel family protein [Hahellaceae bacterium]